MENTFTIKDKLIGFVLLLILFLFLTYHLGYLNEGFNSIISNIPILGDLLFFIDTYDFFRFLSSDGLISVESGKYIIIYIISFCATYETYTLTNGIEGFSKVFCGILIYFIYTIMLKMLFIDFTLNFITNTLNSLEQKLNSFW